jgi:hypothetical protein
MSELTIIRQHTLFARVRAEMIVKGGLVVGRLATLAIIL